MLIAPPASSQEAAPPLAPAHHANLPTVAILLCTYNGARYLTEQLDSFERQTHANWKVWVSDDGSTDQTLSILQNHQEKRGSDRLTLLAGPRAGSTRNFMSLVHNSAINADYYAFSDQDDIWESQKVERAVAWLQSQPAETPALYCGRSRLVDEHNRAIGLSPLYTRPPSFQNALVQNIAGGNTMVFNSAARAVLGRPDLDVFIHDWWVYLAVSACGGTVYYDPSPSLRYRQHQDNQIGIRSARIAIQARVRRLLGGRFKAAIDKNIACTQSLGQALTPTNRDLLEQFRQSRTQGPLARAAAVRQLGLYQQTPAGNVGLMLAALLNKL